MSETFLTPKQKQLLDYISSYRAEQGYAPSQQEIARHFGFKSLGTVQDYLTRLERQGALQKTWNARRGMKVVPSTTTPDVLSSARTVPLPLSGQVAAGRPIEAIDQASTVDVPVSMLRSASRADEHFVLRVSGDSMIEDGILSGDYVVIRKQAHAEKGQTVVALIHNEATIKRFHPRGGKVELHPANPNYAPIVVDSGDFKIEGILAGLIRQF